MIRLQRIGRKNDPAFRILVLEKTSSPKAGSYTDLLGTYNPKTKAFTIAADRLKDWIGKGAQVSPSLWNLLIDKGIIEGKKSADVVSKSNLEKNVAKRAEEEAAAKAAEEAAAAAPAEESAPAETSSEAIEEAAIADADDASSGAEAPEAPAEETPAAQEAPAEEAKAEEPAA